MLRYRAAEHERARHPDCHDTTGYARTLSVAYPLDARRLRAPARRSKTEESANRWAPALPKGLDQCCARLAASEVRIGPEPISATPITARQGVQDSPAPVIRLWETAEGDQVLDPEHGPRPRQAGGDCSRGGLGGPRQGGGVDILHDVGNEQLAGRFGQAGQRGGNRSSLLLVHDLTVRCVNDVVGQEQRDAPFAA